MTRAYAVLHEVASLIASSVLRGGEHNRTSCSTAPCSASASEACGMYAAAPEAPPVKNFALKRGRNGSAVSWASSCEHEAGRYRQLYMRERLHNNCRVF